jgi:hypothetical protein
VRRHVVENVVEAAREMVEEWRASGDTVVRLATLPPQSSRRILLLPQPGEIAVLPLRWRLARVEQRGERARTAVRLGPRFLEPVVSVEQRLDSIRFEQVGQAP